MRPYSFGADIEHLMSMKE